MAAPLEGITVLDWTQWQMGPWAAAMLGDLGAEVIHIENRDTGDHGRELKFAGMLELPENRAAYFEVNNRGKKSIAIDLMKKEGKEALYRMVKKADVFLHNFRQGVPEKLGMDYETLSGHNPLLIYAAASGYGPNGPESREPAFDLVGLARSGIMTAMGGPDTPPQSIAGAIADQMGGIMTAYGILAAIIARERLGVGQKVDVSHLGSMMTLLGMAIGISLYHQQDLTSIFKVNREEVRNPLWNYYPCADGTWIMLGMLQPDRKWTAFCKGLGIEHLEKDPKFENAVKRMDNAAELIAIMDKIFLTKTASQWVQALKAAGDIICTPVQGIYDLQNDPQVIANNYILDADHEIFGPVKVLGLPMHLSKTPGSVTCEAPAFGQHTEEVLMDLAGYAWEEIAALKEKGVII
jgi:crotonobetainyl-CoA:carnitine CoA-transferase CaiB-like acyl-CoA transferase